MIPSTTGRGSRWKDRLRWSQGLFDIRSHTLTYYDKSFTDNKPSLETGKEEDGNSYTTLERKKTKNTLVVQRPCIPSISATTLAEHQIDGIPILNVIVPKGVAVLQHYATKHEALLEGAMTGLRIYFHLDTADCI